MWVLVNVALDLHSTSNMVPVCMLVIATPVGMLHLLLADWLHTVVLACIWSTGVHKTFVKLPATSFVKSLQDTR